MRRQALILVALVSSCVLPEFSINPALDKPGAGAAGGSSAQAGKQGSAGAQNSSGSANGGSSSGGTENPGLGGAPEGGEPGYIDPGMPAGGDGNCGDPNFPTLCGTVCRNLSNDWGACGDCAIKCPRDAQCVDAKCACPENTIACDGACLEINELRCGACLTHCQGAESCFNQECIVCPTGCADLKSNNMVTGKVTYYLINLGGPKDLRNNSASIKFYSNVESNGLFSFVTVTSQNQVIPYGILTDPSDRLVTIGVPLFDDPNYSAVTKIGFSVTAESGNVAASEVWVDSISVTNDVVGPWDFTTAGSISALAYDPALSTATGSVVWVQN